MPRRLRLYAPNGIFHITARTQGRQHWFDEPVRDAICAAIEIALRRTDAKLRGCVVMSNHLHLLVQQGELPLCAFMQPLLCRIALAVRRKYNLTGHIFERRFWERLCSDTVYLATLLDYIHHNPVRAELCASPRDWRWSSFGVYNPDLAGALPFIEPLESAAAINHAAKLGKIGEPLWRRRPTIDLRDLLNLTVHRLTKGELNLETVIDLRGRNASRLRNELIKVAVDVGYRGAHIARSLRMSEATVSKIAATRGLPRSRGIA